MNLNKAYMRFNTDSIADYRNSELVAGIIRKIPKLPAYAHTLSARLLEKEADSGENRRSDTAGPVFGGRCVEID